MPMTHDRLWALAPEQADAVFSLYREEAALAAHPESRPTALAEGRTTEDFAASMTRREGGVAVISVNGPIDRTTQTGWISGQIFAVGQDAIRVAVGNAVADPGVRAVLLSINSPGGVVNGTKELADYIADIRAAKPVATYVDGLAASAAYWLASATGRVLAPATGQVGSIGVIMCVPEYSGFYQRAGVSLQYIASGKFKGAGRGERPLTEEERAYFQDRLTAIHAIFKADVAGRMGITAPEPLWGEAQVFLGAEAKPLGLVTEVVRDEAAAIQTLLEENMPNLTLEALSKEAPELVEAIRAEARAEGRKEAEAALASKLAAAARDGGAGALAAMKAVCRAEDVQAVENLLAKAQALNLTPEQLAGVADLFPRAEAAPQPEAEEDGSRAHILAALQGAHTPPVNAGANTRNTISPLVADAERRAAASRG